MKGFLGSHILVPELLMVVKDYCSVFLRFPSMGLVWTFLN